MRTITRRRLLVGAISATTGAVVAACERALSSIGPQPTRPVAASPSRASPPATPVSTASQADERDLRRQVGQMLLVGFRGLSAESGSPIVRDIASHGLGGVILFDRDMPTGSPVRNIESPAQTRQLVEALQNAARASPTPAPLLVAVDQEGGRVARLGAAHGFPAFESAAELGRRDDPDHTLRRSTEMAEVLHGVGINLNLAPVLDLDLNPDNPVIGALDRSFSADPAVVVRQARAFIEGHRRVGVRTAAKHFPGHGSSTTDSHRGVVDVTDSWTPDELIPYRTLIAEGALDTVLTAHVFNARLDPDHPATLSARTIGGLLRDELGHSGVVISDDLQMAAIRDEYGMDEALALAVGAGVDLLLLAQQQRYEENLVADTVERIVRLVQAGRLSRERVAAAAARVDRLKSGVS